MVQISAVISIFHLPLLKPPPLRKLPELRKLLPELNPPLDLKLGLGELLYEEEPKPPDDLKYDGVETVVGLTAGAGDALDGI